MNWNTIKVGFKNLLLHKLRSLLTMLGVILGVGSVISMLAVGEGSKKEALDRIRQLGANNVIIRSVKPNRDDETAPAAQPNRNQNPSQPQLDVLEYGLTYKDFDRLLATLPTIQRAVPISLIRSEAVHLERRMFNARILGTTPDFLAVKDLTVSRGRFITNVDVERTWNVAVLAAGAADRLFSFEDPIGQYILLGTDVYRVVGVIGTQGSGNATPGAVGQQDLNNDIYIPISCARNRFGDLQVIRTAGSQSFELTQLHEITLTVTDESLVSQTAAMVRKVLARSHPEGKDFEVQVPLELLAQAEEEKRIWNLVLGSIAGISLLVGGIGIMNIMLASVTERTREIGIRRALGARRRDITYQFVIETVLLSSTGGILGVILGIAIPVAVSIYANLQTSVSLWSVLMAFGISVGIGIVFGIYPARRAALMDPIEALRHE
jgi:putative ABC transport system permease protein